MESMNEQKNIYSERNEVKKKHSLELKIIRINRRKRYLFLIIALLTFLSILNIYSASFYNMGMKNQYFITHAGYFFISYVIMILVSLINYKNYEKNKFNLLLILIVVLVLGSMPILASVLPKIVPRINGAIGWIRVGGISVQPAEFFKIFFIILVAHRLSISERERQSNWTLLISNIIIPIIFIVLIKLQNDLGTIIHYCSIFLFMFFMSKITGKWIFIASLLGSLGIISYMGYAYLEEGGGDYKKERIKSYINGLLYNTYDNDKGYQVSQSLIGMGNGKLWGTGYGNGIQKYSYLPEIHTDFIVASFGEEFGLMGLLLIIFLFVSLFNQIKGTAVECEDYFGKYLSIGISGFIFIQFLINVSVAIGLLPVFGIPMPIMSYGGTSLITVFFALGIIFNINNQKLKEAKELRGKI